MTNDKRQLMNLNSQLFLDGGDPEETRQANELLQTKKPEWGIGIQGQTTNPTLVSKNPDVQKYIASGKRLTQAEAAAQYKKIVLAVAEVSSGPISIQVIGDQSTSKDDMLAQARVYKEWISNGVVKFPCTGNGLAAAEIFCQEFPVNITLNFSQPQAAAVYGATKNHTHRVFISPFVGRLDSQGENGMQVVENELKMYQSIKNHVEVLTASVRKIEHLLYALALGSPAITIPYKIIEVWATQGFPLPDASFMYDSTGLAAIPFQNLDMTKDWRSFNLSHPLTDAGLTKFMQDWKGLLR